MKRAAAGPTQESENENEKREKRTVKSMLLIFLYAAVIGYQVPQLIRNRQRGELIAFSALMAIAIGVSLPLALGVKLPSPTKLILLIFAPINRILVGAGGSPGP